VREGKTGIERGEESFCGKDHIKRILEHDQKVASLSILKGKKSTRTISVSPRGLLRRVFLQQEKEGGMEGMLKDRESRGRKGLEVKKIIVAGKKTRCCRITGLRLRKAGFVVGGRG